MALPDEDLAPYRARVSAAQADVERFDAAVTVLSTAATEVRALADPARTSLTPEAWSGRLAEQASEIVDQMVANLGTAGTDLDDALVACRGHLSDAQAELGSARAALRTAMAGARPV